MYRKRPWISRTFFHKIEAKNQGCGLSTETSVFGVPVCLAANLALQEFFQMINFHFSRTTEHQPTRNLHSYTQLFVVAAMATDFQAYFFRHLQ